MSIKHHQTSLIHIFFTMPRNNLLNEFEKGVIMTKRQSGMTIRQIGIEINRSKSAVGAFIRQLSQPPRNKRKIGRPSKCGIIRFHRRILRHLQTPPQ